MYRFSLIKFGTCRYEQVDFLVDQNSSQYGVCETKIYCKISPSHQCCAIECWKCNMLIHMFVCIQLQFNGYDNL